MKRQTIEALENVIEGLLCFVAAQKPSQADRDKALSGLVELRDAIGIENVTD